MNQMPPWPVQKVIPIESPVWSAFDLGTRKLRNRLIASPISVNFATLEGAVTADILDFYESMGHAGVGMVTIGATAVSAEGGSTANCMHIGPAALSDGLRLLADKVRGTGAASSLQLFHVGAQGNTNYTRWPVVGPSPYVCKDIGIEAIPLDVEQIERIEDNFVDAVLIGLECGFDFVELHLGHGYLLHQFLSPHFNKRSDRYGGNDENRLRIVANIIDKLSRREPNALSRLGARISGNDFIADGLTIERNQPVIDLFDEIGLAYWVVSAGIYNTAAEKLPHMQNGDYWRYAAELRQRSTRPVVAQGGVRTLEQADEILRNDQGDLVGLGQALIADRNFIVKSREGRVGEILPCTECRRCRYLGRKHLTFSCMQQDEVHAPSQ